RAGDYADCAGAAVTVVTAGANQKPGESRLELAQKNAGIFQQMIPSIVRANPKGLILVATNPVDVLTRLSADIAGLPPGRVLGSGTILDTARFRYFIGNHVGVSPKDVDAYIIGEHGDSEVAVWSQVSIGSMPLADYCAVAGVVMDQECKDDIFRRTRRAAYDIIERKGATYYAIGAGLVEVVRALVRDEHAILPVASPLDIPGFGSVCCGLPSLVNREGVVRSWVPSLTLSEREAFERSLEVLCASFGLL
ncbi:L-lactate dehydrogenase, partial [bacterium]